MIIAHSYYTRCKAVRKCITIHLNMSCVCACVWAFFLSLSFSYARSLCGQSVKQCAYLHMCKSFILLVINQLLNEVKKNKVNVIFQINLLCERRKKETKMKWKRNEEWKKKRYLHTRWARSHSWCQAARYSIQFSFVYRLSIFIQYSLISFTSLNQEQCNSFRLPFFSNENK